MSNTIAVIMLAAMAAVAIWAQWCAIRRAEDLACKLAQMRDEAGKLYAENMRLRDELEARR
jgi:ferritin-like protein